MAPTTCFQLKAQNSVKIKESDFNFDPKLSLKLEAKIKKACDFRPKLNFGIPPFFSNVFNFKRGSFFSQQFTPLAKRIVISGIVEEAE